MSNNLYDFIVMLIPLVIFGGAVFIYVIWIISKIKLAKQEVGADGKVPEFVVLVTINRRLGFLIFVFSMAMLLPAISMNANGEATSAAEAAQMSLVFAPFVIALSLLMSTWLKSRNPKLYLVLSFLPYTYFILFGSFFYFTF